MRPLMLLLLAGCSATVQHSTDARCLGDTEPTTAPAVQATASATRCLQALCAPVSQCGEVTSERPICVIENNEGLLLSLYACPPGCCY